MAALQQQVQQVSEQLLEAPVIAPVSSSDSPAGFLKPLQDMAGELAALRGACCWALPDRASVEKPARFKDCSTETVCSVASAGCRGLAS